MTKAGDVFAEGEPRPSEPSRPIRGTVRIQVHVGNRQPAPEPQPLALDQRHGERIEVERRSRSTHIRVVGPQYQTTTGVPSSIFEGLPKLTYGANSSLDPSIKKYSRAHTGALSASTIS